MFDQQQQQQRVPTQPLHPSILPRLDPEYISFHTNHLQFLPLVYDKPWDPAFRAGPVVPGGTLPSRVGKLEDYNLTHTKLRAFTPPGDIPPSLSSSSTGWPVLIYFHGGGWTFGNIASEESFSSRMCLDARCVVVSVDYRLAPEHPYPAAVEDAIEALQWVVKNGKEKLNVDLTRIAVGGSSSGGNLAAVLALQAPLLKPALRHPIMFQLLIVPVTDNTSTASGKPSPHASWERNVHTPWLSPARMLWFRNNYLPDEATRGEWRASPLLAPEEVVKGMLKAGKSKCWVAVTELDILRDEGVAFSERLRKEGGGLVEVEVVEYKKCPHPIMAMDGVLEAGRRMVSDAGRALKKAFWDE
ncbi:hypothetical protein AMATHDRAFT_76739 [Amanita thiersii Skay4041]|uniref:Alpha/beta hydrolase fold-3 domain-containing protein n=1 Tax=Amanita thiersii Skay4041 TaxID=703135 RepID=A0A2A9NEE6_9AGAR|nr:hypothetical protein AMATHDRAFT_76739 [Amanita thiersii Skay4041]